MMTRFAAPTDGIFNRGPIADPAAFAKEAGAASWLFLCGDEFAAADGGISYDQVLAAVPESANIVSYPPRELSVDLIRQHIAALDRLPRPPRVPAALGLAPPRWPTSPPDQPHARSTEGQTG